MITWLTRGDGLETGGGGGGEELRRGRRGWEVGETKRLEERRIRVFRIHKHKLTHKDLISNVIEKFSIECRK